MPTLDRLWASHTDAGRPIDIPFRDLAEMVTLRTGEFVIIAGDSGGGKSTLALNWAWRTQDPCLYIVQEGYPSVRQRLTAFALGRRLGEIHPNDKDYYLNNLAGKRDELVVEHGPHTLEKIEARLIALHEWLMQYPSIIFIDNVKDIEIPEHLNSTNDYYAVIFPALKQFAIKYDCVIVGLHHSNRGSDAAGLGTTPLSLGRLLYGGDRDTSHVWGVYHSEDNTRLYTQVLKQRDGEARADGSLHVTMEWHAPEGVLYSR